MGTLRRLRGLAAGLLALPLAAACGGPITYTGHTVEQALAPMAAGPVTIVEQVPTVYPQLTVVIYTTPTDPMTLTLTNDPTQSTESGMTASKIPDRASIRMS